MMATMKRKLTRRQLASGLAAVPLLAQPQTTPPKAADELAAARARTGLDVAELRKATIGTFVEPAFSFKA
jgi:hypothetical protein